MQAVKSKNTGPELTVRRLLHGMGLGHGLRGAENRTHAVGQKRSNELGLFDMSDNVREWVQDCWHGTYVNAPSDGWAWEEGDCTRRVIRRGSWYGKPSHVRSANRFWYVTYSRNNNLGFRLALTPIE